MLTVETFVHPSQIHGIGLFTPKPIESGTMVVYYEPSLDNLYGKKPEFPPVAQAFFDSSAFYVDSAWLVFSDNARFINHHRDGNLGYCTHVKFGGKVYFHAFIALGNIPSGAELTVDYSTFDKAQYERITAFTELRDAEVWPPRITKP